MFEISDLSTYSQMRRGTDREEHRVRVVLTGGSGDPPSRFQCTHIYLAFFHG